MQNIFKAASRSLASRVAAIGLAASALGGCTPFPTFPGPNSASSGYVVDTGPCGPAVTASGQRLYDAWGNPKRNPCVVYDWRGHPHVYNRY